MDVLKQLWEALTPYTREEITRVKNKELCFAHYTSAENAINIISGKSIWLRNSHVMNDYSEVHYGHNLVSEAWLNSTAGIALRAHLDEIYPDISVDIFTYFKELLGLRKSGTFLAAITEHDCNDSDEGQLGRLSMWRAYGGDTNVALVFKSEPILTDSIVDHINVSPVLYADLPRFLTEFSRVVDNLRSSSLSLKNASREQVMFIIAAALHYATVATKHPGFKEEKEWRVIYSPGIIGRGNLHTQIKTLGGIPQRVAVLDLKEVLGSGPEDRSLTDLIEGIVIGPTAYPWPIWDALVQVLTDNGVQDAASRVRVSLTPLRR